MNRELLAMVEDALTPRLQGGWLLTQRHEADDATSARPSWRWCSVSASGLNPAGVDRPPYGRRCTKRERGGAESWAPAIAGLQFLARNGVAHARRRPVVLGRDGGPTRVAGYGRLFAALGVAIDAQNPAALGAGSPRWDARVDVPEITTACWGILKKSPDSVMCAHSRMVVKRKGAAAPGRAVLHPAALRRRL